MTGYELQERRHVRKWVWGVLNSVPPLTRVPVFVLIMFLFTDWATKPIYRAIEE